MTSENLWDDPIVQDENLAEDPYTDRLPDEALACLLEVRRDEEGYLLLPSLYPLYTFSEIQGCYIPNEAGLITYFSDMEGKPVSVQYARICGYWVSHDVYSSRAGYEAYEARRIAYLLAISEGELE